MLARVLPHVILFVIAACMATPAIAAAPAAQDTQKTVKQYGEEADRGDAGAMPGGGSVRQERVATFWDPAEVLISNDLTHVAVIDQRGRKQRVVVDGKEGPEYDEARFLEHDGPTFGPGGMPVLYAGANEGRWHLVTNGRPGPECDTWLDQTPCGPDRTGIAYTAVEIARKAFVAVDGQAGPVYDDVSCPVLSADRKRIAYVEGRPSLVFGADPAVGRRGVCEPVAGGTGAKVGHPGG